MVAFNLFYAIIKIKNKIMSKNLPYIILLLFCCFGCNIPNELPIYQSAQQADQFARGFITNITQGQLDSCLKKVDDEYLNEQIKAFLTNAVQNMSGALATKIRVVECNSRGSITSGSGSFSTHRLGYEYTFEKANVLFTFTIREKGNTLKVVGFDGIVLKAPLDELTRFTLTGKTLVHYVFLGLTIIVPIFIVISLITLIASSIPRKKKLVWTAIIVLVNVVRFVVNWNTAEIDFQILHFNFFGGFSFVRPSLASPWLIGFNLPLGAILFWMKRKDLLIQAPETEQESEMQTT